MEITMDMILTTFKNRSKEKSMKDIKAAVVASLTPPDVLLNPDKENIEKEVEKLIKIDKKLGDESYLRFTTKNRYKIRRAKLPDTEPVMPTVYTGTAGECAVISELMFKGYNANRMMIDEGVDIIAFKDNMFYYLQVKTTTVKTNGTIVASIDVDRFEQYHGKQMRYVIVVRYEEQGKGKNMFFVFAQESINNAIYNHCIKKGDRAVSIKIRFNERTGEPMLYDEKEMNAGYYMNNFNL